MFCISLDHNCNCGGTLGPFPAEQDGRWFKFILLGSAADVDFFLEKIHQPVLPFAFSFRAAGGDRTPRTPRPGPPLPLLPLMSTGVLSLPSSSASTTHSGSLSGVSLVKTESKG